MNEHPSLPDRIQDRADFDRLLAAATNYEEKMPRDGSKRAFDLSRMEALLASVGDPQRAPAVQTFHVAGSKGKGTVARLIANGLRRAGRRTGLFTSPHLVRLNERIAVDGVPVSDSVLARAADQLVPYIASVQGTPQAPTFFEILTAVAFEVFRDAGCNAIVLEVGLGGRLDSTNVCEPDVTVITTIELEHTRLLGDTLAQIAREKAGILKPGVPAITTAVGDALDEIRKRAEEVGARLTTIGRSDDADAQIARTHVEPGPALAVDVTTPDRFEVTLSVPLAGTHHAENLVAAWAALAVAGYDQPEALLADSELPGLLEPVADDPLVLVDGAHTPRSARATRSALAACWPNQRVVLLTAMLEEKNHAEVGAALTHDVSHVVVTQVASPRCTPADQLAETMRSVTDVPVEAIASVPEALARARALAAPDGIVLATGSVYLAGDVKGLCA